jgi:hypothetical protein
MVGKPCAGKPHARFDEGPLRRLPQISGPLYEKSRNIRNGGAPWGALLS